MDRLRIMPKSLAFRIGFGICLTGLLLALVSLIPGVLRDGAFPWPLFVGAFIYLPGAFLAFFGTKGEDRNKAFRMIRFIRLGFIAVFLIVIIVIWQL